MKKIRSFKGFTLVELIVVIAIFGILIAAALAILGPVNNVYKSAYTYSDSAAVVDNVSMYIEDNLRYSNRLYICDKAHIAVATDEDLFRTKKVEEFMNGYHMADAKKVSQKVADEKIYVMKIDNPDGISSADLDAEVLSNSFINSGKISMWTYQVGTGWLASEYKEWAVNRQFYNDYTFTSEIQSLHSGADSREFTLHINLFHNDKKGGSLSQITNTKLDNNVSFPLVNLINSTGKIMEDIYVQNADPSKDPVKLVSVPRFEYKDFSAIDSDDVTDAEKKITSGNDIYFIYTKTPAIEKLTP